MTHTKGPWHLYRGECGEAIAVTAWATGPNGGHVAWSLAKMPVESKRLPRAEIDANAARIVSCVNALEGLNPDAVADVVAALEALVEWHKQSDQGTVWQQIANVDELYGNAATALARIRGEG